MPAPVLSLLGALVLALAGSAVPAAESGAPPASSASTDELVALKNTLADADERARLIQRIDALIAARRGDADVPDRGQPEAGVVSLFAGTLADTGAQARLLVAWLQELPLAIRHGIRWFQQPGNPIRALTAAGAAGAVAVPALAAAMLVGRVSRRLQRRLLARPGTPVRWWLALALPRVLAAVLPGIAAMAVALAAAAVWPPPQPLGRLVLVVVATVAAMAAFTGASRTLLAPGQDQGMPGLAPETAAYAQVWIHRFAFVLILGTAASLLADALGASAATVRLVQKLAGLPAVAMAIVLVLQLRTDVAERLRGPASERAPRARFADSWHVLAVVLLLGAYAAFALGGDRNMVYVVQGATLTLLIVGLAFTASAVARAFFRRSLRLGGELTRRFPELAGRSGRYLPALDRLTSAVIYTVAVLALLQSWGLGGLEWLSTPAGRTVGTAVASIVVIVAVGFAAVEVGVVLLERSFRGRRGSARRLTILPLARNAIYVTVVLIGGLMVLAQLGINIGPLLAGAGVLGLAVGFGAQSAIEDIITGFFILLEDSVAVGDWVDIGTHSGEVETLTLRALRLRDLEGYLHTVPFSKVGTVTNMSRDYNFALVDLQVGYEASVDAVVDALASVTDTMQSDADWAPLLLGRLEVFGLNRIADSALEVRVRLRTRPGQHWAVRREFLKRAQIALRERGIELPVPRQTLYVSGDLGPWRGHHPETQAE